MQNKKGNNIITSANPTNQDWLRIGQDFANADQWGKALWCYRQLDDGFERLNNQITSLIKLGGETEVSEADRLAHTLMKAFPQNSMAWDTAGCVDIARDDFNEARKKFLKATDLNPNAAGHQGNLGFAYQMMQRFEDSEQAWAKALAMEPAKVEMHTWLGMIQMLRGNWKDGLMHYDARHLHANPLPRNGKPIWQGESLKDKTILIWREQGSGDCIQFVRYAPLLKTHFGAKRVIVLSRDSLYRLMRLAPGVDEVITEQTELPEYDYHVMMLGVFANVYRTLGKKSAFSITGPYLKVKHMPYLGAYNRKRIGLCWQGNHAHRQDKYRSIPLEKFEGLVNDPDIDAAWVSAQVGEEFDRERFPLEVLDTTDFLNFAQWMQTLDLVITVDTAVTHLAGALGIPCWTLLAATPDWRWGLKGETASWYENMRLFRQKKILEWGPVIEQIRGLLRGRQS